MSRELRYLAFAVEHYRRKKGLTGPEAARLFSEYDLYQLILANFFLYHIESPNNMVADLDELIATGEVLA